MTTKKKKNIKVTRSKKSFNQRNVYSWLTGKPRLAALTFVLLFASVGAYLLFFSHAATEFTLVGTHPQASQQSSALGKSLLTLQAWNGHLYAGYGDMYANIPSVAITPFDPATNTFSSSPLINSGTSALYLYRPIGSNLFAPAMDREGATDYAKGALDSGNENWRDYTPLDVSHAYDLRTLNGTDLYVVGSQGRDAVVWRSADNGATWAESLRMPTTTSYYGFYFAGVYNNRLYVQVYDSFNGAQTKSKVFDGSAWSDGPSIISLGGYGFHSEVFNGQMIFQGRLPSEASDLMAFNGTKTTKIFNGTIYNYTIDGAYLYALSSTGVVYRTTDLANWQTVASAPSTSRSIAILNNTIFVGTTDSTLYKQDISGVGVGNIADTTAPQANLLYPTADSTVSGNVNIVATATDDRALTKIEIFVDGKLLGSSTTSPITKRWSTRKVSNGSHSITIKAYDAAGNVGQSSASVVKN
ncbi:MAG: Ig-like domain-containing protein [Patescibacteria group bacterium]